MRGSRVREVVAQHVEAAVMRERIADMQCGYGGSVTAVAERIDLCPSTLWAYMTGDRLPPLDKLVVLCGRLEIDKLEMFEELAGCEE